MSDTEVVCRSTRYGAGCDHPVTDHDGDVARNCCCCNWQHNDPDHVRDCIHCHARRIKAQLGGTATVGEIAPHMPQHLVQPWWRWAVDRYLDTELAALSRPDPGYPRFAPDAMLVVDAHNGPETWTGAQWNEYVERAQRTQSIVTVRLIECPPLTEETT